MGATPTMRYRPADEQIIGVLRDGRNLATNIAEETELSRQYVSTRLAELADEGHVKNIGNGLYELVREPDWSEVLSDHDS
jgi:predicted transcriptional regulator